MSGPAPAAFAAVVARELLSLQARVAALQKRGPGAPGGPGKRGKPGKDAPAPTAAQIRAALKGWLEEHATVLRGDPGHPGKPGKDAPAPTPAQLRRAVQAWMRDNAALIRPEEGKPGPRGPAGWTPRLRLVNRGTRSVIEITGWTQGSDEPTAGYLGATGVVESDRDATDIRGAPGMAYGGGGGLTREEVLALIEENAGMQFDDYAEVEYLEDQTSSGVELVFTFSAPVQFVVVEMVSTLDQDADAALIESLEGRVTTGAQAPAANLGAILKHEVPVTLLTTTDTVRVLPAADTRVSVYGKRRPAG